MLSGRYKSFLVNDINPLPLILFRNAIAGRAKEHFRWFSREEFKECRNTNPYAKYLFSFSNNGVDYAYPPSLEEYKRVATRLILSEDWKERRALLREVMLQAIIYWEGEGSDACCEDLGRVQSLEHLERLERLESLNCLPTDKLTFYTTDYRDVEIPPNSTVYCDIPYRTAKQAKGTYIYGFDYDSFYEWALSRDFPVYVSEYEMPEEFTCVKEISHNAIRGVSHKKVLERVFVQAKFAEAMKLPA